MALLKYKPEQIDQALSLREEGKTFPEIAQETGLTSDAAKYHCLRNGVEGPRPSALAKPRTQPRTYMRNGRVVRLFTAEEDEQINRMAMEGKTNRQIGDALGREQRVIAERLIALARREERAA